MTTESRNEFIEPQRERLEHMAFRQIKNGLRNDEFVAIAIDVDDPTWTHFVKILMPGITEEDWQAIRDKGEKPVARGTVMAKGLLENLSNLVPDIKHALTDELPKDVVRLIVLADGGASVYHTRPFPHFREE